jgi:hypothetical protein
VPKGIWDLSILAKTLSNFWRSLGKLSCPKVWKQINKSAIEIWKFGNLEIWKFGNLEIF